LYGLRRSVPCNANVALAVGKRLPMRDVLIGRHPDQRLEIFTRERDAWRAKRLVPGLRLYRYALVGEAMKKPKTGLALIECPHGYDHCPECDKDRPGWRET
jgi:hypothetical protein